MRIKIKQKVQKPFTITVRRVLQSWQEYLSY